MKTDKDYIQPRTNFNIDFKKIRTNNSEEVNKETKEEKEKQKVKKR